MVVGSVVVEGSSEDLLSVVGNSEKKRKALDTIKKTLVRICVDDVVVSCTFFLNISVVFKDLVQI